MGLPHWEYFLSIESDLANCSRFVEFCSENFKTHSTEFARIIMASCSEFDTVIKMLCKSIDQNKKPGNILDYYTIVISKYPTFVNFTTHIPRFNMLLKPWNTWSDTSSPVWWTGYNKIKHERDKFFEKANLENTIMAVAGLLCGILHYYRECFDGKGIDLNNAPKLFVPEHPLGIGFGDTYWQYHLPGDQVVSRKK